MVMVGTADYNYRFNQISADTDNALNAGITVINTGSAQNSSLCNTFSNLGKPDDQARNLLWWQTIQAVF